MTSNFKFLTIVKDNQSTVWQKLGLLLEQNLDCSLSYWNSMHDVCLGRYGIIMEQGIAWRCINIHESSTCEAGTATAPVLERLHYENLKISDLPLLKRSLVFSC